MDEQQITDLDSQLRSSLREHGLDWITREVDQTIQLGKPAMQVIEEQSEIYGDEGYLIILDDNSSSRSPGRKKRVKVPTTTPFRPDEKLELILDALDRTLVAIPEMADHVASVLIGSDQNPTGITNIVFERDGDTNETLLEESRANRMPIEGLAKLLTEIRNGVR